LLTRRFVLGCLAFYASWFAVTAVIDKRWNDGFLGDLSRISFDGLFFVLSPLLLVLLIVVSFKRA